MMENLKVELPFKPGTIFHHVIGDYVSLNEQEYYPVFLENNKMAMICDFQGGCIDIESVSETKNGIVVFDGLSYYYSSIKDIPKA